MALSAPVEINRTNQIANMRTQIPLQNRQMQNEDLQMAQGLADMFGKGQHTASSGTSTTRSNNQMTGPAPIIPYEAFMPAGPNMPGPQGGAMLQGAFGSTPDIQNLVAAIMAKPKPLNDNTGVFGAQTGGAPMYSDPTGMFGNVGYESQYSNPSDPYGLFGNAGSKKTP
jgi:hypothetical protein